MYDFLVNIAELSDFLPLIFLFRVNNSSYDKIPIPLIDFVILKLVIMIFSKLVTNLDYWEPTLNCFFQNSYSILYFLIVSRIYKEMINNFDNRLFDFGNILFFLALIINFIAFDFRYVFMNYLVSVINVIFVFFGIVFFISSKNGILTHGFKKFFWLNIAFLIYNACMFPAIFFDHLLIGEIWTSMSEILWSIVIVSTLLLNLFISIFLSANKFVRN